VNIEPPSLDVPVQKRERWGLVLLIAGVLAVGVAAIFNMVFAITLAASCVVGLPVIWLFFFPPYLVAAFMQRSSIGRLGVIAVLFTYFALSKIVLVPLLTAVMLHALQ
jgi:hypothetical protein